jgi:hypothetical protein
VTDEPFRFDDGCDFALKGLDGTTRAFLLRGDAEA